MGRYTVHMDSMSYAAAVAANIESAIKARGMTVLSVSQSSNIPRTTLERRLRSEGASPFTVREVKQIAEALGISAAHLTTVYAPGAVEVA